jgi:hypothetical protein
MIMIWINDYVVVMVYDNQKLLGNLCLFRIRCKPSHVINRTCLINMLNST